MRWWSENGTILSFRRVTNQVVRNVPKFIRWQCFKWHGIGINLWARMFADQNCCISCPTLLTISIQCFERLETGPWREYVWYRTNMPMLLPSTRISALPWIDACTLTINFVRPTTWVRWESWTSVMQKAVQMMDLQTYLLLMCMDCARHRDLLRRMLLQRCVAVDLIGYVRTVRA